MKCVKKKIYFLSRMTPRLRAESPKVRVWWTNSRRFELRELLRKANDQNTLFWKNQLSVRKLVDFQLETFELAFSRKVMLRKKPLRMIGKVEGHLQVMICSNADELETTVPVAK